MRILFLLLGLTLLHPELYAQKKVKLESKADSAAYAIGVSIGSSMKQQGLDVLSPDLIKKGLEAAMDKENTALFSTQDANVIVQKYIEGIQKEILQKEIDKGAKYLAENGKRNGVTTLPSGLQYEVMVKGTGPVPAASDKVKTHYHGTLIDGQVFDSSVQRGQPISFSVGGVIKGWQEALQLMPVGSKWKLYIPYDLAYGERGSPPKIPGGAALVFEVELIEIVPQ